MFRYWPAWERNSAKRRFFSPTFDISARPPHIVLCIITTIPLFFNECFGCLKSCPCFCLDNPNIYQFCRSTPHPHLWYFHCQLVVIFGICHIEFSEFCFLVDELFGEAEVDEDGRLNYEVSQLFSLFLIVQLCFQKPKKVVAVIMIEPPKFRKLRALWNLMTMISQVLCQVLE